MEPSAGELAEGQRACERIEAFQRYSRGPWELAFFFVLIAGVGVGNEFERGGWKPALWTGLVWLVLITVSLYQLRRQKQQVDKASAFLSDLKSRYGDGIYAEIQKSSHSFYYYFFLKRYPPFNRQVVKLP